LKWHLSTWKATFVISFNSERACIWEKVGDVECSSDWVSLYMTSGNGVRSIIRLIWGFLLVDGTDEIEDLADWKSEIIVGRKGSRCELNRSKALLLEVSEIEANSLIVIFWWGLGSGIISSSGMVVLSHFSLLGT